VLSFAREKFLFYSRCVFLWLMSKLFGTVKELEMHERTGGTF